GHLTEDIHLLALPAVAKPDIIKTDHGAAGRCSGASPSSTTGQSACWVTHQLSDKRPRRFKRGQHVGERLNSFLQNKERAQKTGKYDDEDNQDGTWSGEQENSCRDDRAGKYSSC